MTVPGNDRKTKLEYLAKRHEALKDLHNHYNSINWQLHAIFIALHAALVAGLAIKSDELLKVVFGVALTGTMPKSTLGILILGGAVGIATTIAWRMIYQRHKSFLTVIYPALREAERALTDLGAEIGVSEFHAHLLIHNLDGSGNQGTKTHKVIAAIQRLLLWIYGLGLASYLFALLWR